MLVREIMTEDVFALKQDRKVVIAKDIMTWAEVRHVPVLDDANCVVGVISRTDLLRAALPLTGEPGEAFDSRQHLANLTVTDFMSEAVCIDPQASVQAAARLMRSGKRNCLPVVDTHGKLLGIVTSHDILGLVENLDSTAWTPELSHDD